MRRTELREHIFKLLFAGEFNPPEEMPEQLSLYFEGLGELSPEDREYMEAKFSRIRELLPEIDNILNSVSEGWKTHRMNRVDLTALRLAMYEVKYDDDVPTGVAINEAVEIAKRFGGDESGSFVNGILGKAVRIDAPEGTFAPPPAKPGNSAKPKASRASKKEDVDTKLARWEEMRKKRAERMNEEKKNHKAERSPEKQ